MARTSSGSPTQTSDCSICDEQPRRPPSLRCSCRRGGATLGRLATADADPPPLSYGHLVGDCTRPARRGNRASLWRSLSPFWASSERATASATKPSSRRRPVSPNLVLARRRARDLPTRVRWREARWVCGQMLCAWVSATMEMSFTPSIGCHCAARGRARRSRAGVVSGRLQDRASGRAGIARQTAARSEQNDRPAGLSRPR